MKLASTIIVLILAAAALFFATGCNGDLWSNAVGYDPEQDKENYYLTCELGVLQLRSGYPFAAGNAVDSPINGLDCSVSTELQGRPLTLSQVVSHRLLIPPSVHPPGRDASSSNSLMNEFSNLFPLMFPPGFPVSDRGKIKLACDSSIGSYLVNHTKGTVTSLGLCPLRILKVIPVRSHPLQLQLTPDGATLLVTSYDGAVTFIDTATDTVAFTLNMPTFNPSGIDISPDGTRAYVTHYLDGNPSLIVIDTINRRVLTTIPLPGNFPRVVALTPDGTQAWVNYYNGNVVTVVDTLTNAVSGTLNIAAQVGNGMAFNPTGTRAFIAVNPNLLYVVDTATLSILTRVTVGALPNDVVVTADGNDVLVTGGAQEGVWVIDARKYTVKNKPTTPVSGFGSMGLAVYQ